MTSQEDADAFEVFEDGWESLTLFLQLDTQWRWVQHIRTGLNYSAVEFLLRLYGVKKRREVFEDIQAMERAALSAWAAEGNKNGNSN